VELSWGMGHGAWRRRQRQWQQQRQWQFVIYKIRCMIFDLIYLPDLGWGWFHAKGAKRKKRKMRKEE
jgi:hypothetical protein